MKKLVSLMLALLLSLACMMLPALVEETDVTGEWYLTEMLAGEESMNPAALGMNMTMVLNADGTAAMVTDYGEGPEETPGTWTLADGVLTLTADDIPMDLVAEEGSLKADIGSAILVFTREAPTVEALPEVIAAESEEAFIGEWTLTSVGAGGALMPASALGADGKLTVEAGRFTLVSGEDTVTGETALTEEGKLALGDGSMTLELNDNGWLSITQQFDEETVMVMYFEQVEEEK